MSSWHTVELTDPATGAVHTFSAATVEEADAMVDTYLEEHYGLPEGYEEDDDLAGPERAVRP